MFLFSFSIFKSLRYVQDAVDDDDDEEEEEEEEETAMGPMQGHGRRHAERPLHLEPPRQTLSGRASPVSPGGPQTSDDKPLIDLSVYTTPPAFESSFRLGRVVKQLTTPQRTGWAGLTQV